MPHRYTHSPIGLQQTSRYWRAAQFRRSGGEWSLHACAVVRRETPVASADEPSGHAAGGAMRLRDALTRNGFQGRTVVVSPPDDAVLSGAVEAPARATGAALQTIARTEFARLVSARPEGMECVMWPLPAPERARQTQPLFGVGCRHADSDRIVNELEAAGLHVSAVEPAPVAAARLLERLTQDPGAVETVAIIDDDALSIAVVHDGAIVYARMVKELGLARLDCSATEARSAECRVPAGHVRSYAASCAGQIEDSITYACHRYPNAASGAVRVTGAGAADPVFWEALNGRLGGGAELLIPGAAARIEHAGWSARPELAVAAGLAMPVEAATEGAAA